MADQFSAKIVPALLEPSSLPTKTTPEPLVSEVVSESRRFSNYADSLLPPVSSEDEDLSQEEEKDPDINHDILQSYHELKTFAELESQRHSFKGKITTDMLFLSKKPAADLSVARVQPQKPLEVALRDSEIRIFAMTWNMNGKLPADISQLVPAKPDPHLYLIGSQECTRSIAKSMVNQSKDLWEQKLAQVLGDDYIMLRSHTMVAIHLSIYVHKSLQPQISSIESADIGTGWAKQGNKGAVAISFLLGSTSFLCVCCHLASGQNNVKRRNMDFARINQELRLPSMDGAALLSDSFDAVVWMGDLNYRVNGMKETVEYLIVQNNLEVLLNNEQLTVERKARRFPATFQEGEIKFPPTYRFDHGTDNYDTSRKQRVPGWCDRILFHSRKGTLRVKRYTSVMGIKMSDHKPVLAELELRFEDSKIISQPDFNQSKKSSICSVF